MTTMLRSAATRFALISLTVAACTPPTPPSPTDANSEASDVADARADSAPDALSDVVADGGATAVGGWCSTDQWCWAFPRPTNFARVIYVDGPDTAWIGAGGGSIDRWDGTRATAVESGTHQSITAMSGLDANNIWAIAGSDILRYDGTRWQRVYRHRSMEGLSANLDRSFGITMVSATEGYASVGDEVLRWNGTAWSSLAFSSLFDIGTIGKIGARVFVQTPDLLALDANGSVSIERREQHGADASDGLSDGLCVDRGLIAERHLVLRLGRQFGAVGWRDAARSFAVRGAEHRGDEGQLAHGSVRSGGQRDDAGGDALGWSDVENDRASHDGVRQLDRRDEPQQHLALAARVLLSCPVAMERHELVSRRRSTGRAHGRRARADLSRRSVGAQRTARVSSAKRGVEPRTRRTHGPRAIDLREPNAPARG